MALAALIQNTLNLLVAFIHKRQAPGMPLKPGDPSIALNMSVRKGLEVSLLFGGFLAFGVLVGYIHKRWSQAGACVSAVKVNWNKRITP